MTNVTIRHGNPEWSLTVNQEIVRIPPPMTPVLDREWVGTDSSGHVHRGAELEATLEERVSEEYYCELCEDEHGDFLGWFCMECGEEVKPGTKIQMHDTIVPGLITGTLTILNGREVWDVSPEFVHWATDHIDASLDEVRAHLDERCVQTHWRWL